MIQKPRLLFISPVMPNSSGGGSAMRADEFVRALSRSYEVHVYVFRPNSDPVVALRKLVYKISPKLFGNWFSRPREWTQFANIIAQFKLRGLIHQHYFEVVHVFKIFLIPIIQTCLAENQKALFFSWVWMILNQ